MGKITVTETKAEAKHPATYSFSIMYEIEKALIAERARPRKGTYLRVLDPFAGTGKIHLFDGISLSDRSLAMCVTYGIEIEPEWASMHANTIQADARDVKKLFSATPVHVICTSPTYANRLADKHNAQDGSYRRSYTHDLGRQLTPGNSGGLQWGEDYRELHYDVWEKCVDVLQPGGLFLLNISDHIRRGELVPVTQWHRDTLTHHGLEVESIVPIKTPRLRHGANAHLRADCEYLIGFRKPS